MTAGVVLEKMEPKQLFSYVYGIVEGLAYARFRQDSAAAGHKDETGMKCIYDWYLPDQGSALEQVKAAFSKYSDYSPPVVIAAIIRKECGE